MHQVVALYVSGSGTVPVTDAMLSDMAERYGGRYAGGSFALLSGGQGKFVLFDNLSLDAAPADGNTGIPSSFRAALQGSAQAFPGLMVAYADLFPTVPPAPTWPALPPA